MNLPKCNSEDGRYFTLWEQITPRPFPNPVENRIMENYCFRAYQSPAQVPQLLRALEEEAPGPCRLGIANV